MSRASSRRAFTFTDLMACLAIGVFLLAVIAPATLKRAGSTSARIHCSSNLKQIGLAIKMYANDEVRNGNAYPRTRFANNAPPVVGTANPRGWNDDNATVDRSLADPFVPGRGAPDPNDVTGALFLVLRTQEITPDTFICPSSVQDRWVMDKPTETVQAYTNWTGGSTQGRSIGKALSYAYSNPYGNMAAISNGFAFNDSMRGDFALMADMNPGTPELLTTVGATTTGAALRKINSPNHDYDGQNVLYADGRVDWQTTPFVGIRRDNIYTARKPSPRLQDLSMGAPAGTMVSPVDGEDTILLPTWDQSIPMPTPSLFGGFDMLVIVGVAIAMIAVIAAAVVIFLLPKRRPPDAPGGGMPPPVPMQ